jgi:CheY-like chemotaxis protein
MRTPTAKTHRYAIMTSMAISPEAMPFSRIDPTRILLVEDDPNDVELIQLALESRNIGNQIDVVNDGEQALNYLYPEITEATPREMPRLVLLDLKLPKVDGITVLEKIREDPRTHNLIVVVMTSSAENQDLSACYRLGVNSYVVKPLDFQQFMDVAQQVGIYWMMLNQVPQNS